MSQFYDNVLRQLKPDQVMPVTPLPPVDIRQYWNVVYRRKWLIIALAAITSSIAAALVLKMTPMYRATATVMIESKGPNVVSIQDVYDVDTQAQEYYQTQFEILKSLPVVDMVIQRLKLNTLPEFSGVSSNNNEQTYLTAVDRYMKQLVVNPIPRTQLARVSFDSHDPKLAATIANAHAQAFIESNLIAKEAMTQSATKWLSDRLDELRTKLSAAEARMQAFKEREHLVDIDGFQALPARQLSELSTKLIDARRDLSQIDSAYAQVVQVRNATLEEQLTIPVIRADAAVELARQTAAAAEAKVAELSKHYGPEHPKMRAAISERTTAEQSLARQVANVMEAIKNDHGVRKGQEQAIVSAINSTNAGVQLVGRQESEYRTLQREVETNRQLFEMFYKRISETAETGSLATPNARIVELAKAPLKPKGPDKNLIVGLTALLSIAAGVILAFLLEKYDNKIKHATDVETKLAAPLLGLVPLLRKPFMEGNSVAQEFGERADREYGEAIRTIRTGITLSSLDSSAKLIMVTSSLSGEGKTTIACNLALSFAQLGNVLLIDADLRRPAVVKSLHLQGHGPGFAELCSRVATPAQCIRHSDIYNIDILSAHRVSPNPQELLSSQHLPSILETFKTQYDRIIIDCPPVMPVSDALLLANCVDALIYVVKADSTTVTQAKAGMHKFKRASAALLGIVLTQVDMKKLTAYGEYGGGNYSYYGPTNTAAT